MSSFLQKDSIWVECDVRMKRGFESVRLFVCESIIICLHRMHLVNAGFEVSHGQ
jgi:hypothetical protein